MPRLGGKEFFTTLSVSEALAGFQPSRRTGEETVLREDALGRVPATPVVSGADLPGFARSTVDGYAVRAADLADGSRRLRIGEEIPAGRTPGRPLSTREAALIMTGAPLPDGADAVVMIERTQRDGETVVIDIGGMLSHGAIVARELGIPCVISTGNGTSTIRSGDRVLVDGDAGTVEILERAKAGTDAS